jgi:hypothetical protein
VNGDEIRPREKFSEGSKPRLLTRPERRVTDSNGTAECGEPAGDSGPNSAGSDDANAGAMQVAKRQLRSRPFASTNGGIISNYLSKGGEHHCNRVVSAGFNAGLGGNDDDLIGLRSGKVNAVCTDPCSRNHLKVASSAEDTRVKRIATRNGGNRVLQQSD